MRVIEALTAAGEGGRGGVQGGKRSAPAPIVRTPQVAVSQVVRCCSEASGVCVYCGYVSEEQVLYGVHGVYKVWGKVIFNESETIFQEYIIFDIAGYGFYV